MATRGIAHTVEFTVWDATNNVGKTGDVANLTLRWGKDATQAAPTNAAAEIDATNKPGQYKLVLTSTETDCNIGVLGGKSSSSGIVVIPTKVEFERLPDALPGAAGGSLIAGSNAATTFATLTSTGAFSINGTSHVAQTGDSYAIVNSGTHGNAAIKGYVDDIGVAGAGLTAIPWNAAWDAEVQSECADALTVYAPSTAAALASLVTTVGVDGAGLTEVSVSNAGKSAIAVAIFDETKSSVQVGSWGGFIDGLATQASVNAVPTVAEIWETALTEAYRATGATGTGAQLLYELLGNLINFANAGTLKEVFKLDKTTVAKSYTYDDGTTPTAIEETT